tara:strand:+ start:4193 stop:8188 length:3996 start_codon:yes stop_codon:yes gene_type:complete
MPTEWTQETVTDSGTATSTTTPSTAWTVETLDLNVGANTLSLTGNLTLSGLAEIGSDTDKFLMSDSGVLKYVTGNTLKSYISPELNDLTDVTYTNGDLTINSLDTIYLPNTSQTYIQTKGKLAFRDWGAGAVFNFLEIDEDNHTIKMDNDTATLTMQVSSSDTYIKSWSGGGADLIVTSNDDVVLNSNAGDILFEKGGVSARAIHSFFNFEYADGLAIFNKFQINNPTDIGDDYFNIVVGDKGATTINTVDNAGSDADLTFDVGGDIILDSAPGNIIVKHNGGAYTPSSDYQVATKKYVDDNVGGGGDITGVDLTADTGILITSETNTTSGSYSATISCNLEGTELYSTGVTGTTKFLRVDGDNSCSWQVPPNDNTNQLTTFNIGVDTNSNSTTIAHGETLTFTGGTGISTETTADGTITITNTSPNVNTMGSGFTVSATTDSNATTITQGDDLMFAAGTGIACETTADGTVTITNTEPNTDTDVTIANLTSRLPQITESLTIGDASDVDITIAGDLTVNGAVVLNSTISVSGASFHLDANSELRQSVGGGTGNTVFGKNAGDDFSGDDADYNTLFGDAAGTAITTGDYNVCIGSQVGKSNQTGSHQINIGYKAGENYLGSHQIAIGSYALQDDTTGEGCVAVGYNTLKQQKSYNTTGIPFANTAVGHESLSNHNKIGSDAYGYNTALGYLSGHNLSNGEKNTFVGAYAGNGDAVATQTYSLNIGIGYHALSSELSSGASNIAIGNYSLYKCGSISNNIAIGNYSLYTAQSWGEDNIAIGEEALYKTNAPDSQYNIAVGKQSLYELTSGAKNISFGRDSGKELTTGDENVFIGYEAGKGAAAITGNKNLIIGSEAGKYLRGAGANNVFIGSEACGYDTSPNNNETTDSVYIGRQAGYKSYDGDFNIGIGSEVLKNVTTGDGNVAIGYATLADVANVSNNVAVGNGSLGKLASGSGFNTAIGPGSAAYTTSGQYNVYVGDNGDYCGGNDNILIGRNAGQGNSGNPIAGENNILIGYKTGYDLEGADCDFNILMGYGASQNLKTGANNITLGAGAMTDADGSESYNIAIGSNALHELNSSEDNYLIAIGNSAGYNNLSGKYNFFAGHDSGRGNPSSKLTGNNNTCVGYKSGYSLQGAGARNTLVGAQVGDNITTGTNNIMLGFHISASAADVTHEIVIGAGVDTSNDFDGAGTETVRIGRASDYITCDFGENAAWAHSSDVRIKKDIKDNELGLDFINDLRTVNYKKKAPSEYPKEFKGYDPNEIERKNPNRIHYGFIAQEVKEAMDKAGHSEFPMWNENEDGMQELSEAELIAPLVKAVQELSKKVEELEKN